jgi:hypothetical protein
VGSSYPPERASHLGYIQKSMFLDDGCIAKSDYVNEFFGSGDITSSKALKKEAIVACRTPKGNLMLMMMRHNLFWRTAILVDFCVKTCQKLQLFHSHHGVNHVLDLCLLPRLSLVL